MSYRNHFWVVVPAAGIGKRMGIDIPKQYISALGKTIIEHTLDKFVYRKDVRGILVAVSESDQYWPTLGVSKNDKITKVLGGEERYESVYNSLCKLEEIADDDDWVLVHDAVRPCITSLTIDRFVTDLNYQDGVGGILALPCSETMKRVNTNYQIEETIDRKYIWHAQTPQMFKYKKLHLALQKTIEENVFVTDEAMAMELSNHKPLLIRGEHDNIKITNQFDIKHLELFLSQEK
mgnify:CR=1 FL=1